MQSTAVKPGYKVTELGVIPEDWEVKPLNMLIESTQLGSNYANSVDANGPPLIKMGNLSRSYINLEKLEYINLNTPPLNKDLLNKGDILFNTRNTLDLVGKVAIWSSELSEAYFNSNIMRIEFNRKQISSNEFMNYVFNSNRVVVALKEIAIGTTSVAAIYYRDLKNILIAVPPLPEQKAIAAALSDVDALITAQEALIDKKRDIKTATMQQLLTGKVRLGAFGQRAGASGGQSEDGVPPGYQQTELGVIPEDWGVQLVKDAFEICNQYRLPLSQETRSKIQGKYPYYGPTRIQDYINEYRVEGTFALIGEDGDHFLKWDTVPMTQLATGKFNVNNHAHLIKGTKNKTEWFYYFFKHRDITHHLSRQGANRYKLNKTTLENIPCLIPPLPEQDAIAKVLSDIDAEITALETQCDKMQAIKQGIMQELLTGKTRLEVRAS